MNKFDMVFKKIWQLQNKVSIELMFTFTWLCQCVWEADSSYSDIKLTACNIILTARTKSCYNGVYLFQVKDDKQFQDLHYRKQGGEVNSNPGQTGREIKECNQLEGISKYRAVRDADIDLPSQSLGIDQIKYIPSNVKLWDAETLDAHGSDYTVAILKK